MLAGNDSQTVGRRILTDDEMRRALVRIAHEIMERNGGAEDVVLIGMHTRGVPIAQRIAGFVREPSRGLTSLSGCWTSACTATTFRAGPGR